MNQITLTTLNIIWRWYFLLFLLSFNLLVSVLQNTLIVLVLCNISARSSWPQSAARMAEVNNGFKMNGTKLDNLSAVSKCLRALLNLGLLAWFKDFWSKSKSLNSFWWDLNTADLTLLSYPLIIIITLKERMPPYHTRHDYSWCCMYK